VRRVEQAAFSIPRSIPRIATGRLKKGWRKNRIILNLNMMVDM